MNSESSRRPWSAATLVAAATFALVLAACGDAALNARAAEPIKEVTQPSVFDPALKNLEGVTHHG